MPTYANPYYDPVKAHEYYEEHKKLKGRRQSFTQDEPSPRSPASVTTSPQPQQKNYAEDAVKAYNTPSSAAAESKRGSTEGLNQEGKAIAAIIKKRIDADMRRDLAEHQEKMANQIQSMAADLSARVERRQKEIASHAKTVQRSIDTLRDEIERASGDMKDSLRAKLYSRVKNLQEENMSKASEIRNEANKDSMKVQAQVASLKAQNDKKSIDIQEDYTERYYKELDKLKSNPEYTSDKGSSKTGSGSSGGSSKKSSKSVSSTESKTSSSSKSNEKSSSKKDDNSSNNKRVRYVRKEPRMRGWQVRR